MDIFAKIAQLRSSGTDAVLVTVTEKEGMSPTDVGKKMVVTSSGEFFGTIGGGTIEHFAIEKCKDVLKSRLSFSEKYVLIDKEVRLDSSEIKLDMACGGKATLFYEFIGPKEYVYIFGAGHCGKEIAKLLKPMDYFVTLIDDREELLENAKEYVNEAIDSPFADFFEKYRIRENAFVVVSTPSHKYDYEVLDKIVSKKLKLAYFGMLCSKKKIHDYLERIKLNHPERIDLKNFYSPIGLCLGGDSPEEVAISVVSEILGIHYKKNEIKHMRDNLPEIDKYFK